MVDWIKKIIPQPEIPGSVHYPPAKVTSPPPEAQKQAEEETNVVGWFVKGLGRMVPQPVLKSKEEASEKTVVQNICICQQPGDLVVEEVEEQQDQGQGQLLREESSASTQVQSTQQEETEMHTEATTVTMGDSQEQMQAESGQVKLDSQAEGDQAAHLAEESAQTEVSKLAEEATEAEGDQAAHLAEESVQTEVSKLAEEATEAEISKLAEEATEAEGDQAAHLAEESTQPEASKLAEEATQASSGEQSANIQEEEMKEVFESQEFMDSVEGTPLLVSAETEPRVPEPKEAEPEKATKRDSSVLVSTSVNEPEPDVVTTQPDPSKDMLPPSPNIQEDETADEGCGVPTSCIAVRNWLMQMPHTSQCLANFNRLLQENAITLPSMPSKPSLGLMCESLPSLPSLPPQFSQLPQRVQQYYLNILSRLRPQQET
ncbi:hypothetical protein COCON_G00213210 [Conger conger]|uniref:Uncharacterized protein n=1 Tax=Conger conger TaxID=82655 RepID=A0A9Q1CY21_CONCO|nr:hypothetical protein COCON_G00213210 [Conger conger]